MVNLAFRLSDRGEVELDLVQPTSLEKTLELCSEILGEPVGEVIATRKGKVIALTDLVQDDDNIVLYPALSGG